MKHRIAIVDDEEKILISLKRYFTLKNFAVDTFTNSMEALSAIKARHHKIVLTDINMPGLDGLGLLTRLKKFNPMIQVVIMTGSATTDSVRMALQSGASGFVVKPFDSLQMLEKEVDKAINNFETLRHKHG
jgi:DNA-binding NtrC family response regulator